MRLAVARRPLRPLEVPDDPWKSPTGDGGEVPDEPWKSPTGDGGWIGGPGGHELAGHCAKHGGMLRWTGSGREHNRMPYTVQVEFRTASSFLVAYSLNVSRGGIFLETDAEVMPGTPLKVEFTIPNAGTTSIPGVVAWRRGIDEPASGPPGIGVEFEEITPELGAAIDSLVPSFDGLRVLVVSNNRQDRTSLARNVKSIFSTAEITQAADPVVASSVLTHRIEVALVEMDQDLDGGLSVIRAAKALQPPVPTIAITSNTSYREQAVAAGIDELVQNPPAFADLQVTLVRALSKPVAVRLFEEAHPTGSGS